MRQQQETSRRDTIGRTGNHVSTAKSGSGFTSMVKEPLMDRMFKTNIAESGFLAEMTSAPTQKSTNRATSGRIITIDRLEESKNYTSSKSYGSSSRIDTTSSQSSYTPGLAAIPPAHSSYAHAGVNDRFEQSSTPDSDVGRPAYNSSKYYEPNDPIRPSSRAPKSREYGQSTNDQEQDQLNRSRLQNSKRWRTPKNGARDRNQQTAKEREDLKEYLNREDPLYPATGSGSTGSHTTGSMSPPVSSTYPYQPSNSPYDYQPNKKDDLIDMDSQNSCDNTGMHNIKQGNNS